MRSETSRMTMLTLLVCGTWSASSRVALSCHVSGTQAPKIVCSLCLVTWDHPKTKMFDASLRICEVPPVCILLSFDAVCKKFTKSAYQGMECTCSDSKLLSPQNCTVISHYCYSLCQDSEPIIRGTLGYSPVALGTFLQLKSSVGLAGNVQPSRMKDAIHLWAHQFFGNSMAATQLIATDRC